MLDDYRVVNEDGLRYEDELVKHKILDAVGDMYLLGTGLIGAFRGYKSGHTLNNQLLRGFIGEKIRWEIVTFEEESLPHSVFISSDSLMYVNGLFLIMFGTFSNLE